jgi:hypothetical protein
MQNKILSHNFSKNLHFFGILKVAEEMSWVQIWIRTLSISQRYRPADPVPHQNVTDPQHWCQVKTLCPESVSLLQSQQVLKHTVHLLNCI